MQNLFLTLSIFCFVFKLTFLSHSLTYESVIFIFFWKITLVIRAIFFLRFWLSPGVSGLETTNKL